MTYKHGDMTRGQRDRIFRHRKDPYAQERFCGPRRKRIYIDYAVANMQASRSMGRVPGLQLRVYQCPHCSGWHLTRQEQRRKA